MTSVRFLNGQQTLTNPAPIPGSDFLHDAGEPDQPQLDDAAAAHEAIEQNAPITATGSIEHYCLRRTGARPVQFDGMLFAGMTGWNANSEMWHEINLYKRSDGIIIVDLRVFKKAPDRKDCFHVVQCDTLDEAATWLQAYDPGADIEIEIELDNPAMSLADLTVQAADLKIHLAEVDKQYRSLIGDLFYQIRLAE